MAQMNTDAAVLAKEAANFERISGELKGVIAHVESVAGTLAGQWQGQAGGRLRPRCCVSTRRPRVRFRS